MPRRALRKLDPSLDLSRHFRDVEELPRPFDPKALFRRVQPLEVEVGSGKGLFIASAARANPEHNFLGIEVSLKYARYAAAKLARQAGENAVLIGGDALLLFRAWFPDASLAAVHVYFPDPWWKKRHKKRRVLNEQFLRDAERTLVPCGSLHFWTDVEEYYRVCDERFKFFKDPLPTSTLLGINKLGMPDMLVEIEVEAMMDAGRLKIRK